MKFVRTAVLTCAALLLAACNFSLAADITPPPGYLPPTSAPTRQPAYPAQPPQLSKGAAIFASECAPCHGPTGKADGDKVQILIDQGIQVPLLAEAAAGAVPAAWFDIVSQGRMQSLMPPFSGSLSEQERWDVVAFALSLGTTPEMLSQGQTLYTASCVECHGADGSQVPGASFTDQAFMAVRTNSQLAAAVAAGAQGMPAFDTLSQAELQALAGYIRSLGQSAGAAPTAAPTATPVPPSPTAEVSATAEPTLSGSETPAPTSDAAGTPVLTPEVTPGATGEVTPTIEPSPTAPASMITGKVTNGSGGAVPSGLTVTLHGFEHTGEDAAAAPDEIINLSAPVGSDGAFTFENIELVENRIFYTSIEVDGLQYNSDFVKVAAEQTALELNPVMYESTDDYSGLALDQVHIFFSSPESNSIQAYTLYIFTNPTDRTILVDGQSQEIPFVVIPEGASNIGYEDAQMGGTFMPTRTGGFAIVPGDQQYGLAAYYTLPYEKSMDFAQPFKLAVGSGSILVPEGMKAEGAGLSDVGARQISSGDTYGVYQFSQIEADGTLGFTLSGKPKTSITNTASGDSSNRNLLIGVGALGAVLIAAGAFLFWRDRNRGEDEEEEDEDGPADGGPEAADNPSEGVVDAILVLDDQFRAGNITEEAYQKRRAELKEQLRKTL